VHDGLWDKIDALDVAKISERLGLPCSATFEGFEITFIYRVFEVDFKHREVRRLDPAGQPVPAEFLEQLCILSYLIHAQNGPLAGKLVKGEQLEAGQFFFRGHHSLPVQDLVDAFGDDPKKLIHVQEDLGGRLCDYGDVSLEIMLLPDTPVTFIVWGADDEFPASGSILFDETVARQLPLDALLAAVTLAMKRVAPK
jgi:hypothetical protein